MSLSEGIIQKFVYEVESGNKQYAQLSHLGYAQEIFNYLKNKYPETVMVEQDYIYFIAFTKSGKEHIRERLQPYLEKAIKKLEEVKRNIEMLGEDMCLEEVGLIANMDMKKGSATPAKSNAEPQN